MIHLTRSNMLSQLSESLIKRLEENRSDDPFKSPGLIVPNLDTARWLQLEIAERSGFAGNLTFMLPAEWQWKQVRKLYPDLPKRLPSDTEPMKWTLFELLSNEQTLARFELLNRYLSAQPDGFRVQAALQLCGQLASIFDQYLIYRPDMILRWQNGKTIKPDEIWQAELWNLLQQTWTARKKEGIRFRFNKAELFYQARRAIREDRIDLDHPLYVFNPGLIPEPVLQLLEEEGKRSDLYLYVIRLTADDSQKDHQLLESMGEENRTVNSMFHRIAGEVTDLVASGSEQGGPGIVRQSLVDGKAPETFAGEGIEVRSCHSPLREIETLHRFLTESFEKDETLHPDDVLVVTPDPKRYEPAVHAIFGMDDESFPRIPYHIGSVMSAGEYGMVRAFRHWLSLPESRFMFRDVMDLLQMRPVYETLGISAEEAARIQTWMEENHVVWGLDAEHRREMGQPAEERQTWRTALRRGWFGQLLAGEEMTKTGTLLYHGVETTSEQQVWAAFSRFLNHLDHMRKGCLQRQTVQSWSDHTEKWLMSFFSAKAVESKEAYPVLKALQQLRESSELAGSEQKISWPAFRSELDKQLEQSPPAGARFTRGVTFSSMVPVRSMPFKIIALIGLDESRFPRKKVSPEFDLMARHPRPSERNRKNEDRNLFLESVMAAGNVHYCSYIGQSREDNEEIPPSPILSEWISWLSHCSGRKESEWVQKEPLTDFSPAAFREENRLSTLDFITAGRISSAEQSPRGLLVEQPIPVDDPAPSIDLNDLIRFLKNPMQSFIRNRFEAYPSGEAADKQEFEFNVLEQHLLFQNMLEWELSGRPADELRAMVISSGMLPSGWQGESILGELRNNFESARALLQSLPYGEPVMHPNDCSIRFGENDLRGTITSYSRKGFLDLMLSSDSGRSRLESWVRYLAYTVSSDVDFPAHLVSGLRSGKLKTYRYSRPSAPQELLGEMIGLYREGLQRPLRFFPKTLLAYQEQIADNKPEKAFQKARLAFEGGGYKNAYGERNDLSVSLLMGEGVECEESFFEERYRSVIREMMDHMEEI